MVKYKIPKQVREVNPEPVGPFLPLRSFSVSANALLYRDIGFLQQGDVEVTLNKSLTIIVGENGSGKTTLLEAIAQGCSIHPKGGTQYRETDDDRPETAMSRDVRVNFKYRTPGIFLRADNFETTIYKAGRIKMVTSNEWRSTSEQSRGEGVLGFLMSRLEASEGMLYILDEPETGLSPQRQMVLLSLLDDLVRDGRSQVLVASHSPILMSHPEADLLWLDQYGIERRRLESIPHFSVMKRFMTNTTEYVKSFLDNE